MRNAVPRDRPQETRNLDIPGVVDAVAEALDAASSAATGTGVSELARRLGLAKSTVHRLLNRLEERGLLRRDPLAHGYHPGPRLIAAVVTHLGRMDACRLAPPHMERLRDATGESVALYVRDGGEAVCAAAVESSQELRLAAPIGAAGPLAVGANGKVLLAFAQGAPPDDPVLAEELAAIRRLGFWATCGERIPGCWAIVAPLRDFAGGVRAVLSLRGPDVRFDAAKARRDIGLLLQAARDISEQLGCGSPPPGEPDPASVSRLLARLERACRGRRIPVPSGS